MRIRIIVVCALLFAVATPAYANELPEPLDVSQGIEVGRAAETNSLNGIYVSPANGDVYVASVGGDEITVHDPDSGTLLDRIGPERGVGGPDDVFITEDGTIYWTEILTGNVGMLMPDGTWKKQFVGPGVNPITMSDDETRLFVNRLFLGQGLYELDPDLVDAPVEINPDLMLNSFDFGPDGYLYAPSFFTGDVLKIDVDSATPVSSEVVTNVGGISSAVKFNSLGEAFAVDIGEGIVLKLDLSGADAHTVVLDVEGTIDNIAFSSDDVLFVAVGADNVIVRIETNGDTKALTESGLGLPGGVAVSPDGTVWVTELFALRGFTGGPTPTTSFYDRFLAPGTGFAGATTVAVDGDNLLLTSGFSNALQVMDPVTGAVSLDVRDLAGVTNAIRHEGEIVATQLGTGTGDGNVVIVDGREVLLDATMTGGTPIFVPLGLASDGDTLYVGDWATGIVWAVSNGSASILAADLAFPEGMALDGDRLLVVETGRQQVTAIDLATGATSPVIVGLDYSDRVPEAFFPFGAMAGVATSEYSIFVSDDGVNKVYEFPTLAVDQMGLVDVSQGTWRLPAATPSDSPAALADGTPFYFGDPGDSPMMGDWNCDGIDTPGLYRQSDGFVYLRNSNTQGIGDIRFFFGNPGDVPIAGDFNGDGCDTVSLYRPDTSEMFVINALGSEDDGLGAAEFSFVFGDPGDAPFVGDFDGDGVDTVALHRASTGFVYYRNSLTTGVAEFSFFWGDPGDVVFAGDWNRDGVDTPALFRPSNDTFYWRNTNAAGPADGSATVTIVGDPYPVSGYFG
jgi:sugar lactone lactonase YvrE